MRLLRSLAAALALAGLALLTGCGGGEPAASPPPAPAATTGAQVFAQHCASCHGPEGQGRPGVGPPLGRAAIRPDAEIRQLVRNGKGRMPASKHLTDAQLEAVVVQVRQMAAGAVTGGPHRPSGR
jgi:cytochrome c oxidase cbb3-type subunit 3